MKKIAYLLPPKQRTIARFMNMNDWVIWSMKILERYSDLSEEEKRVFSFIPENASLIEELFEVQKCIMAIEKICKEDGFSVDTARQCQLKIRKHLFRGNERMISLGGLLHNFLTQEVKVITTGGAVHNNSSDIIESIFGKYKARKSPNKLNGITSFVLFIPLQTTLSQIKIKKQYNFKMALENIRMKDIKLWGNKNLTPNLNQLRINKLKNIENFGTRFWTPYL
ncbi:hypothetical protein MASR2M117_24040 [Paludibacter sp.]